MNLQRIQDLKHIFRLFLLIYIPIAILTFVSFQWQYDRELEKTKTLLASDQKQYLASLKNTIELQYEDLFESLFILANSNEMSLYANDPTEENKSEMAALLVRIANSKPQFAQIRLLDQEGYEIVRVNQNKGIPFSIPANQLQDKSDRYYFKQSQSLKSGEVYVSDMDLNVENNRIEMPYSPTIRVATPVHNSENQRIGLAIINYDAEPLLQSFKEISTADYHSRFYPMLVNEAGGYLFHTDPQKTFGFMFEDAEFSRLQTDNPDLWQAMAHGDSDIYETPMDLYRYETILPGGDSQYPILQQHPWHLIARTELSRLPIFADAVFLGMDKQALFILLCLAILSLAMANIAYFFKKDQAQLQIALKISENTHDAILVTDHRTRILNVNDAFEKATGYRREEVLGLMPNVFKSGKQSKRFYENMWSQIRETGKWEGELWDRKKDGTLYPKALRIYAVRHKYTKRTTMYIGIFHDLTTLKKEQALTNRLKHYNPKTDLPNEALLDRLLEDNLRTCENKMYLVSFSIENFASLVLTEQSSHDLIKTFLKRLQALLQEEDFIAQTNENQFVIGLPTVNDLNAIQLFLAQFSALCKDPIALEDRVFQFEIKTGIAAYPADAASSQELLVKSYLAMQSAIRHQGTEYKFYDTELQKAFEYHYAIASNLQSALDNQEFHLVYQPQVDLNSQKVTGAEALLRWNHPKLGFVSPGVFIPIAEEKQFIVPLGYWIIENAFRDLQDLQGVLPPGFRLSINLSTLQFKDKQLIPFFIRTAQKYDIDLTQVEIEITETVMMTDLESIRLIMDDFHLLGVSVAIDDFGTGFSSLSYLHNLPLNKLKVDRAFIKEYPHADSGRMAKVIANLAKTLDMTLLMEGAETSEQIQFLRETGYDQIQGYYYSKPLDKDGLVEYLRSSPQQYKNKA